MKRLTLAHPRHRWCILNHVSSHFFNQNFRWQVCVKSTRVLKSECVCVCVWVDYVDLALLYILLNDRCMEIQYLRYLLPWKQISRVYKLGYIGANSGIFFQFLKITDFFNHMQIIIFWYIGLSFCIFDLSFSIFNYLLVPYIIFQWKGYKIFNYFFAVR